MVISIILSWSPSLYIVAGQIAVLLPFFFFFLNLVVIEMMINPFTCGRVKVKFLKQNGGT